MEEDLLIFSCLSVPVSLSLSDLSVGAESGVL